MNELILASGSPRRKTLLENYGFKITVVKPEFDEALVKADMPCELVTKLALAKNRRVRGSYPNGVLILSADTVVALGNRVLGKPRDEHEARGMLELLSDNTHMVFTGVCVSDGALESVFYECSDVTFYKLSASQIERYIATGSPFDKAGGYGIQDDMGIGFVKNVSGELSNVIGLPMGKTIGEIEKLQGVRK